MSQPGPGNLLDLASRGQTKKTSILVGNPQIPPGVLRDSMYYSAGNPSYRNEPAILQIADPVTRADPDPPAIILKQRMRDTPVKLSVTLAVIGKLRVIPAIHVAIGGEPDAPISVRENGPYYRIRQTLVDRKCGDGKVPKAVEAVLGSYPDAAFVIFQKGDSVLAREAV